MKALLGVVALLGLTFAATADDGCADALDQANAQRAARGLPAFQRDHGLTAAAKVCATFRAARGIRGHTGNDFVALPAGASAKAAGCAAWAPGTGFGACALYDQFAYAGAASAIGADGLVYHHLFVSNTPSATDCRGGAYPTCPERMPAGSGSTCQPPEPGDAEISDRRVPAIAAAVVHVGERVAYRVRYPFGGRLRHRGCGCE